MAPETHDFRQGFDHERWRNIWAGVQSIALAAGVVVGGFWTAIYKSEINLLNRTRVSIDLKAAQLTFPDKGERLVRVDLLVTRNGNWTPEDWVDLKNVDFAIYRITKIDRDSTSWTLKEPWRLHFFNEIRAEVEAGETKTYEAIQSLPEPGLYVAQISVPFVEKGKSTSTLLAHILFIVK